MSSGGDLRAAIAELGTNAFPVDDLRRDDLARIAWSGSPRHLESVAGELDRVELGEVEYLAVRAPDGAPVGKGGIDYRPHPGAGELWQLATRGDLEGLGLGSRLIAEAERRIRRRGLSRAVLEVEDDNPRARALYEWLGYAECGRAQASWEAEDETGRRFTHVTELAVLEKRLEPLVVLPRGLVVLVGAPGAGKSSFAAQLVLVGAVAPGDVVSSDAISEELYGPGDNSAHDPAIFGERDARLRALLRAGRPALADSTNARPEARARLVALARELGVPVAALRFAVPLETLRRRQDSRAKQTVPVEPFHELVAAGIAAEEGFALVADVPGAAEGVAPAAAALRFEIPEAS